MSSEDFQIRDYRPADAPALYDVCLKTGDAGADGSAMYAEHPDLLGAIYVGPYLELEPSLALVLEDGQGCSGYCLGAFDTASFHARFLTEWIPSWQRRHPLPSEPIHVDDSPMQRLVFELHHPSLYVPSDPGAYPSHLHIDLLPRAQGLGWGKRLMEVLLGRLRAMGSSGVHLGMAATNDRAGRFYRKLGFELLEEKGDTIYMGLRFKPREIP